MEEHVQVLFQHNDLGRITRINEPPYDAAPMVFVGITKSGRIIRFRDDLSVSKVENIRSSILDSAEIKPMTIIGQLQEEKAVDSISFGPAFIFPKVGKEFGATIQITETNRNLLMPDFPFLFQELEYKTPVLAVIRDDKIVSICHSSRKTARAAEAGLYTAENSRGRGYASAVAIAWARELQSHGKMALYSTSWDNLASQSVARHLGLIQFGMDLQIL